MQKMEYEQKLKDKDEDIDEYRQKNDALSSENSKLRVEVSTKLENNPKIKKMKQKKDELKAKVKILEEKQKVKKQQE